MKMPLKWNSRKQRHYGEKQKTVKEISCELKLSLSLGVILHEENHVSRRRTG